MWWLLFWAIKKKLFQTLSHQHLDVFGWKTKKIWKQTIQQKGVEDRLVAVIGYDTVQNQMPTEGGL